MTRSLRAAGTKVLGSLLFSTALAACMVVPDYVTSLITSDINKL
jgi:hypothetical protein